MLLISQPGLRLLSEIQRITRCTHTFSSSLSQIIMPLSLKANLAKLGRSLSSSTKKTVPQYTWHSANNSIHLHMTPLSASSSLSMWSSQLFNNSELGHILDDLKISNKLLIGLHKSWAPVCTVLSLCEKSKKLEIEKITSALQRE